jgi:hypothetical protein
MTVRMIRGVTMRHSTTVAALGLCTLLVTGCGPGSTPTAAGGASTSGVTAAASSAGSTKAPAAAGSLSAACDAVAKAVDAATAPYADELTAAASAAAAQDPAAQQRSADAMHNMAVAWAGAMRDKVGTTGDADFDALLTEYAAEMDKVAASIRTHADISGGGRFDSPELVALTARLDKKCPSAT